MPQASWIALILVMLAAFLAPYAVGAGRRRLTHPDPPMRLYAPHLMFLGTVRIAPMLTRGVPSAGGIVLGFIEAFVIWALCASINEWFLRRRMHRGRAPASF
jgi:hypothetical protein